jgi:imidazolonepropionase-like amidohydrolase
MPGALRRRHPDDSEVIMTFSILPTVATILIGLAACVQALPQTIALTARRTLDVASGRLLADHVVRIEDGIIAAVLPRGPGDAAARDLGDVTLLPGLIDLHTHLIGSEEDTPYEALRETAARAAIEGVANARKTIEAGFTTVRDLGSRDFADAALRDAIAAGRVPGPRLLVAIRSLSPTGGHGDRNDLPADVKVERYSGIADGPEEIRKKVRENVKHGADWIKVLATGGVMSASTDPHASEYTEEELRAAVRAAAEKGRDVAAHAHGKEGILRAARAGVRSIEHASHLDDEAIAVLKERGTFIVPNPYTNIYMLERGKAGGYQDYQLAKAKQVLDRKLASLRLAIRAGVPIAYGTDSGVQPHGLNGRQFAVYVDAGMTPLQAIQSATVVAARLLRMEDKLGKLAKGCHGDVIAVRGNPLEDIRVLEAPVFVVKDGVVVKEGP